jgi:hypothetical protein
MISINKQYITVDQTLTCVHEMVRQPDNNNKYHERLFRRDKM